MTTAERPNEHIVVTPSGKKVDTARLVMGVGYLYADGTTLTPEDKAFVDAEITKRAKKSEQKTEKTEPKP